MKIDKEILKEYRWIFLAIGVGVIVTIIIITIVFYNIFADQTPAPTQNTSQSKKIVSYQHTFPGISKTDTLGNLGQPLNVETLENGNTLLEYSSVNKVHNNQFIANNNIIIFERSVTVNDTYTHPMLSEIKSKYGEPEREFKGSKKYGEFMTAYVYAQKGFTVIANPFTQEVEEIQVFLPMTVEDYIDTWGSDITEYKDSHGHFD